MSDVGLCTLCCITCIFLVYHVITTGCEDERDSIHDVVLRYWYQNIIPHPIMLLSKQGNNHRESSNEVHDRASHLVLEDCQVKGVLYIRSSDAC